MMGSDVTSQISGDYQTEFRSGTVILLWILAHDTARASAASPFCRAKGSACFCRFAPHLLEECMTTLSPRPIQFGPFELDPIRRELRKGGLRVKMTPHQLSLLCLLLELPLRVQTREEIQRRLWPGNTFVDFEHGINKVVHSLRTTLGDSATNARYIETVNTAGYRTTGYRFIPHSLETSNDTEMRSQPRRVGAPPITSTGPEEPVHHRRRVH